jgi:hypothetical protein
MEILINRSIMKTQKELYSLPRAKWSNRQITYALLRRGTARRACGRFCRGGFSHANATLFGSASSAEQQDSQQLEVPKPAHSGEHILLAD